MEDTTRMPSNSNTQRYTNEKVFSESEEINRSNTPCLQGFDESKDVDSEDSSNLRKGPEEENFDGDKQGVEKEKTEIDSESEQIAEPFDPTKIKIDTKEPSIDLIINRIEREEIDLNPDFQRNPDIWNHKYKSRLIESLLLRIPLPVFYMAADRNDNWQVVDGLQRLGALKDFILDKKFSLRGLEYLDQYNNKAYDELPRAMQRRINETQLSCHVIDPGTPPKVMYNIFKRINTGGRPLSPQEIRHALYPGKARDLINELAASEEFKIATDYSVSSKRMADRECVLRFAAFYSQGLNTYSGHLDGFLIEAMKFLNDNHKGHDMLRKDFKRAMKISFEIFGDQTFRKSRKMVEQSRSPINKALLESWSVNLAHISEAQCNLLVERKEDISHSFLSLIENKEFFDSISIGTQTINQVHMRFGKIKKLIEDTLK